MTQLGTGLARRGHDVTMLTGGNYGPRMDAAGLRLVPLPAEAHPCQPQAGTARVVLPALLRRYLAGRTELPTTFIDPLVPQFRAVQRLQATESFDAVLADIAFTGVLPLLLGDAPRPPVLLCGVGPITLSSRDTPPFGMAWQPDPGFDYRTMNAFAHCVLFGDVQARLDRALRSVNVGPAPAFVTDWPRLADGLLQLSVPAFEYRRTDLPDTVEFVGPMLSDVDGDFHVPHWSRKLREAGTVVLVTQGTLDNGDLQQLVGPTLRAFADRHDVLVVATTGGAAHSLRHRAPDKALLIDWVPYGWLMPHVDVMVTNGGYGGVHYALAHGVPLVVAGESSDKGEIAARITHAGVGLDLGTARPSPAKLRAAVDRVLGEPAFRAAARRLRDEIRCCTDPVDVIEARLAEFSATGAR